MFTYIIRRLLQGLVVIVIVSFLTFGLMHLAPGDPIDIMVGEARVTDEQIERIRAQWGLDRPFHEQYITWVGNVLRGDFGQSVVRRGFPVSEMVREAAWVTVQLNVWAMIVSIGIALPVGMIAAIRRYSTFDYFSMLGATLGVALPNFWVGLMLIILFAGVLGGTVRILAGIVSLDRDLAVEGAIDVGSGIGGAALLTGGKAIAFVQTVAVIQAPERQLSGEEVTLLKRVFHNSVALYNVRLVEGRSGLFGINDRPFTLGNTIYLKDRSTAEQPELLVHECIHVWQYQHMGARYTMDAVGAQKWYEWFTDGSAYDWKSEFAGGKTNWLAMNSEAQGRLFQEIYVHGSLWDLETDVEVSSGGGVFYDADGAKTAGKFPKPPRDDYTDLGCQAVDTVRGARGLRLSQAIG
jgi:hypothetical protein